MLFQYYGYGRFGNVGAYLQQWGVFDVLLPFMLVFAIIYAALNQLRIFTHKLKGADGKTYEEVNNRINVTLAFVIAFMFIGPHLIGGTQNFYTRTLGIDPVIVINAAIPHVGLLAVAATLALILAGLFGFSGAEEGKGATVRAVALGLSVLGILAIFAHAMGLFHTTLWFLNDPGLQMAILVLLVFGGVAYFMVGGGSSSEGSKGG